MDEHDTIPEAGDGPMVPGLTPEQYAYLLNPLRKTRIAKRSQGGKQLSYLEAWDVKAHLTRIFGFGNWDSEVVDYGHVATREYANSGKDMVEVIYRARVQLTIRDQYGNDLCRHSEVAVGSTSGPANMLGEHHDNAVKTAASDALKRCAINLGTQFGLSLYDNGNTSDVVRQTLVKPVGYTEPEPTEEDKAAVAAIEQRIGAVQPETGQDTASPAVSSYDPAMDPSAMAGAQPSDEPPADQVDHPFQPSHTGMVCEAMVMRDGGGDQCGLPPEAHPQPEGVLAKAVTRSQAVDEVRQRKDALTTEQQDELRTWWSAEGLPTLTKLSATQAPVVLARIDLIEKQALITERLGGEKVEA